VKASYVRFTGLIGVSWAILRYAISSPADRLGGRLLTRLGKGVQSLNRNVNEMTGSVVAHPMSKPLVESDERV
jgi:hypothetical protein